MKYHILHDFGIFTLFKEKSSDRFKDLRKLKLLTKSPGGVMNYLLTI